MANNEMVILRTSFGIFLILAMCVPLLAQTAFAASGTQQLIVGFHADADAQDQARGLNRAGIAVTAAGMKRGLAENAKTGTGLKKIAAAQITVDKQDVAATIRALQADESVSYVEVDAVAKMHAVVDDPQQGQQWALSKVGSFSAWDRATGDGILIAIIDTGVDYTHPDLDTIPGTRIELGYDYAGGDTDPRDEQGHGTHVAGIAAARTNNATGIAGMAPDARILAIRVLDAEGYGQYSWIASGVMEAADRGAHVINLSLGGDAPSLTLKHAISYANAKGAVVTCAAGNSAAGSLGYPARYGACFSVGATTSSDGLAYFSNIGSGLDITAPGVSIRSTVMGTGYQSWSGTSMATPVVSGIAALVAERGLTGPQIESILKSTAVDRGAAGYDTKFGWGRVNANAAVIKAASVSVPAPVDDTTNPVVSDISLGAVETDTVTNRQPYWKIKAKRRWRLISRVRFSGNRRWTKQKQVGSKLKVGIFYAKRGRLYRQIRVYRRAYRTSYTHTKYRTVTLAATDNTGVSRVGFMVNGDWQYTDWSASNGFAYRWKCSAGIRTFKVYAFDVNGNSHARSEKAYIPC